MPVCLYASALVTNISKTPGLYGLGREAGWLVYDELELDTNKQYSCGFLLESGPVQCNVVNCSAMRSSVMQCSLVQYGPVYRSAVKCNTVLCPASLHQSRAGAIRGELRVIRRRQPYSIYLYCTVIYCAVLNFTLLYGALLNFTAMYCIYLYFSVEVYLVVSIFLWSRIKTETMFGGDHIKSL